MKTRQGVSVMVVKKRDAFALPLPFEDEDETGGIGDGSEETRRICLAVTF